MDEAFETLTLMQTGKSYLAPVVLLDEPNGNFWERWHHFIEEELLADGYISPRDLKLVRICHDANEAVDEICRFYATYHSMRWVGSRLVLRLQRPVSEEELAELNAEFADIVAGGEIAPVPAESIRDRGRRRRRSPTHRVPVRPRQLRPAARAHRPTQRTHAGMNFVGHHEVAARAGLDADGSPRRHAARLRHDARCAPAA